MLMKGCFPLSGVVGAERCPLCSSSSKNCGLPRPLIFTVYQVPRLAWLADISSSDFLGLTKGPGILSDTGIPSQEPAEFN